MVKDKAALSLCTGDISVLWLPSSHVTEEVNFGVQRMKIFSLKMCSRAVKTVLVRREDFYSTLPHFASSGNTKKLKRELSLELH